MISNDNHDESSRNESTFNCEF